MINEMVCYEVLCDGGCDGQGWPDGSPHFTTAAEAQSYALGNGFRRVGVRMLCGLCARRSQCDRVGHRWDPWFDCDLYGIDYRERMCSYCDRCESDPPIRDLSVLFAAARVVDGLT